MEKSILILKLIILSHTEFILEYEINSLVWERNITRTYTQARRQIRTLAHTTAPVLLPGRLYLDRNSH